MAVLPSAERATETPCGARSPAAPVPTSLLPLLGPDPITAREDPCRADDRCRRPTDDRGVAVGGEGDRITLKGLSHRTGADQLAALLGPHPVAAGEDPRRAETRCRRPRPRWRCCRRRKERPHALEGRADRTGADQLFALLAPHPIATREDPRRAGASCRQVRPRWRCCRRRKRRPKNLDAASHRSAADQLSGLAE